MNEADAVNGVGVANVAASWDEDDKIDMGVEPAGEVAVM